MAGITKPKKILSKFSGPRNFLKISRFQKKVYAEVKKIPRGKVVSYGDIARKLKTSPRAVGQALKRNFDKRVPCHRVVMADGRLGGYNRRIELKERLLRKEGVEV